LNYLKSLLEKKEATIGNRFLIIVSFTTLVPIIEVKDFVGNEKINITDYDFFSKEN
jgi:hypothetical protein